MNNRATVRKTDNLQALEDLVYRMKGLELAMGVCRERVIVKQLSHRYHQCEQDYLQRLSTKGSGSGEQKVQQ